MSVDPSVVQFYSGLDTFKFEGDDVTETLSVPSQSYSSGQTRTFTVTLDLDRDNATTQLLKRFSFDSTKYYSSSITIDIDANFRTDSYFTVNNDTITFSCLVWNASGTSKTLTAFTVDLIARKFVTPYLDS